MSRCAFRPRSFAAAEAGCPLDHCICGAHVVDGDGHEDSCKLAQEERASFEAACREHDAEFALTLPEGVTLRSATTLPAPAGDDLPEPLSNRFFHRH